jgi:VIT1/CCC1 family predicted Fe2+/Mn2+ transporter
MKITEDDREQFIFGVSDGMTSALGVVIPMALLHQPMLAVISGLATCATIGMAGGEFLSDDKGSLRQAVAMGVASFLGSVLPAVPFFFLPYHLAIPLSAVLCLGAATAISEQKSHKKSRLRAYLQTFGILGFASAVTVGLSFATGVAG